MAVEVQGTLPTQKEPLCHSLRPGGNDQVENNEGGFVFAVEDLGRLQRYAIIGCEGGTYYAMEEKLDRQNISCIDRLIAAGHGEDAINLLKDISVNRRNIKQNSLLKAFSILARTNDQQTKEAAYAALSDICHIPTHLFMFIKFCEEESDPGTGWGRAHKRAISRWYKNFSKNPEALARLVTKYKNREKWSHKDVLRLAHTSCRDNTAVAFILRYIVKDYQRAVEMYKPDLTADQDPVLKRVSDLLAAFDEALLTTDPDRLCSMIREYRLTWEQCPTNLLRSEKVWCALLPHMPIEALVRNLGRMTALGMFAGGSEEEEVAVKKIQTINTLSENPAQEVAGEEEMEVDGVLPRQQQKRRNMLHPFKILVGMYTYKRGHGEKGSLRWTPNSRILAALDKAFYQAFEAVEPTNKKFFLAVDVSGSMSQPVLGSSAIDCATAAAAMMMVTLRTEKDVILKGFSHQLRDLGIDSTDSLDIVVKKTSAVPMGGTDCAQPMICAMEEKVKDIDAFVVYTDNETWHGKVHPCEALQQYRKYAGNPDVKLIVCGMCSTQFTIADPDDKNMLDVVGFDSSAPRVISEFVLGHI